MNKDLKNFHRKVSINYFGVILGSVFMIVGFCTYFILANIFNLWLPLLSLVLCGLFGLLLTCCGCRELVEHTIDIDPQNDSITFTDKYSFLSKFFLK
jgi:hypothetical protein